MAHEFILLKLLAIAIVIITTLSAGIYPFFKRIRTNKGYEFPLGEALASGVFLGAGLLHMLGDSAQSFISHHYDYPFAFLLAGITFLILLLFEHIGRELHEHNSDQQEGGAAFAILAMIMLSIHSFLAGAALGLSQSLSVLLVILLAIVAHKWAASFALAVQINKSPLKIRMGIILFTIFAIMTPLGIIFGEGLTEHLSEDSLVSTIFSALAAGTFLYLGTLHGLKQAVMVDKCCDLKRFFFVIIGFAIMAIVAIWT
ncbi:MAG: ZIP family metal transporter [Gammaproteobacteria bacterium]|nr:ZIP family metal transporter [Gammaproteobacteria bacterium]MCP4476044.1 ZIP family metal transporter [Gammaproteobacteria bacterium]